MRRAFQARDRGCRFPGCGVRHAQGHHIHHWANGGPTRLDNLALLCRRHHRAVHEEGYRLERDSGGTPAVPVDAAAVFVPAHRAEGLPIDAATAGPGWGGERLDLGWAISVLHPATNPRAYRPRGHSP